jgi:hypothetical protein
VKFFGTGDEFTVLSVGVNAQGIFAFGALSARGGLAMAQGYSIGLIAVGQGAALGVLFGAGQGASTGWFALAQGVALGVKRGLAQLFAIGWTAAAQAIAVSIRPKARKDALATVPVERLVEAKQTEGWVRARLEGGRVRAGNLDLPAPEGAQARGGRVFARLGRRERVEQQGEGYRANPFLDTPLVALELRPMPAFWQSRAGWVTELVLRGSPLVGAGFLWYYLW